MGQFIAAANAAFSAVGGLEGVSTILGIGGTIYQTLYQRQVANNTAAAMEDNARRASFAGQIDAQDADMQAAAAIAAQQEGRSFSGFSQESGTFRRIDRRNRILARRDALRLRNNAEVDASSYRNKAAEAKAEGRSLGLEGIFNTVGKAFDFGSSLINDATVVNTRKARAVNRISTP